ncbi:Vacuolar iron transporter [Zancudomyces culisetae]|uniref:Vacuolar iron transporter n=1 Tax=Zancudomyces culisetae TaxID=1213189 RepID=A0A1R1PJV1_ZANCU|nr:Vacuolar iron transporter [Zancudomyces culisetae]|eukprot:OMH81250.1 Vacuolar iron transporter [Zancudomyces culisetae]
MQREGQPLLPTSTKNTTVSSNALSLPSQYPRGFTPPTQHNEQHRMNAEVLRDAIIGLADGLTVPFALAAGLSGLYDNNLVVIAGFAGIFSHF